MGGGRLAPDGRRESLACSHVLRQIRQCQVLVRVPALALKSTLD